MEVVNEDELELDEVIEAEFALDVVVGTVDVVNEDVVVGTGALVDCATAVAGTTPWLVDQTEGVYARRPSVIVETALPNWLTKTMTSGAAEGSA